LRKLHECDFYDDGRGGTGWCFNASSSLRLICFTKQKNALEVAQFSLPAIVVSIGAHQIVRETVMKTTGGITAMMTLVVAAACLASEAVKTWKFDNDRPGVLAEGFYAAAGQWKVMPDASAPSKPNVLAQMANSSNETFNLALVAGTSYRDVDLTVKMRAIGGAKEQGGGLVWRAKDARNYYVACYNPLESKYRLYKVLDNGRIELASTGIMPISGWHILRIVMVGNHIECYFDGNKYLDIRDSTYTEAGRIGLWTKADAQTFFDDLAVTVP